MNLFLRKATRFRWDAFGDRQFAILLTHWFYFTNHAYAGEPRYFMRVGARRMNFGRIR